MLFRKFLAVIFVFAINVSVLRASAAEVVHPCHDSGSDLITDRLTGKQLKHWYAIKRVVLAVDNNNQPLHPTLHRLWRWAETSGHAIYIELQVGSDTVGSTAGSFRLIKVDPRGVRHMAVIRLYLANIDYAYVGPQVIRSDGLIPMEGLRKHERYAEVLGHELAHAYYILTDLERVKKVYEVIEQTNVQLLSHYAEKRGCDELGPEMLRRLEERDSLLEELEPYAEGIETEIWHELIASQKVRSAKRGVNEEATSQLQRCLLSKN